MADVLQPAVVDGVKDKDTEKGTTTHALNGDHTTTTTSTTITGSHDLPNPSSIHETLTEDQPDLKERTYSTARPPSIIEPDFRPERVSSIAKETGALSANTDQAESEGAVKIVPVTEDESTTKRKRRHRRTQSLDLDSAFDESPKDTKPAKASSLNNLLDIDDSQNNAETDSGSSSKVTIPCEETSNAPGKLCLSSIPKMFPVTVEIDSQSGEIKKLKGTVTRLEKDVATLMKNQEWRSTIEEIIIENIDQKLTSAKGKKLSFLSRPFFSAGYKMCLKIFPNRVGKGKESYLSLFFVIMKGDQDQDLDWPFNKEVTIQLNNPAPNGVSIVARISPGTGQIASRVSNLAFERPGSEMNAPIGFPQFISHKKLRADGFIKNNTITFQVVIGAKGVEVLSQNPELCTDK